MVKIVLKMILGSKSSNEYFYDHHYLLFDWSVSGKPGLVDSHFPSFSFPANAGREPFYCKWR